MPRFFFGTRPVKDVDRRETLWPERKMVTTRETGAAAVSARPAPLSTNQGRAGTQLSTASRAHLYAR
jgi:hypothetical protein